jgi:hypothetical protein
MLHTIHIAITQAGANFQWGDYDRCPELQTHTLLGVGKPAVALKEAGSGLVTNTVGAAAKSVCAAGIQRGPRHGDGEQEERKTRTEETRTHTHTENRENERSKPKKQNNGVHDAKGLVGYGGGG